MSAVDGPPSTPAAAEGWFSRWRKDKGIAIPGLAAAVLGLVVGALTGVSGPDASVLAAVLPAVLTLVGTAAGFLVSKGDSGVHRTRAVSGLIILFALGLPIGAHFGAWYRSYSEGMEFDKARDEWEKEQQQARQDSRNRHTENLKSCTILEFRMNAERASLGLPRLTIWQVCPFLDNPRAASVQMSE